jgi:hypothetical protein
MTDKKCSLKVVSDNGNLLHGTAAINAMISRAGGFDQWVTTMCTNVAKDAAERAVTAMLEEQSKPKLRVVK